MRRSLGPVALGFVCAGLALVPAAWAQSDETIAARVVEAERLERTGQLRSALDVLEGVLDESPAEPRAIMALQRVYRRVGRPERAVRALERAIAAEPGTVAFRQMQLQLLSQLDRDQELRSAGESWLRETPRSEAAYREYAATLRREGAPDEAVAVLRRGRAALDRPDALARELARLLADQGRWADAAREWAVFVRVDPAARWAEVAYEVEARGATGVPLARELVSLMTAPGATAAQHELAAVCAVYAGRSAEAIRIARGAIDRLDAAGRRELATRLARASAQQSQHDVMVWSYRRLLADTHEPGARWDLARRIVQHDLAAGDTASAAGTLAELLGSAERGSAAHRWGWAWRIRLLAAGRQVDAAERALSTYARTYPEDSELTPLALAVAESNLRLGRFDAAERVVETLTVDAAGTAVAAQVAGARGYLALYAGDYAAAAEQLEAAAAGLTGAERRTAIRFLGFLRYASDAELAALAAAHRAVLQGRSRAASDTLGAALERTPSSSARPALLLYAGELALAAADLEGAERMLGRVVDDYPESPEAPVALVTRAEALAGAGRLPTAIELLERVIVDYPDSALTPIARRRLAELRAEVPRS